MRSKCTDLLEPAARAARASMASARCTIGSVYHEPKRMPMTLPFGGSTARSATSAGARAPRRSPRAEGLGADMARVHPLVEQVHRLALARAVDAVHEDHHREAPLLRAAVVLRLEQGLAQRGLLLRVLRLRHLLTELRRTRTRDISGVKFRMLDTMGNALIEADAEGPLFFVTPSSGRWTFEATWHGQVLSSTKDLTGRRYLDIAFDFKSGK
jgi:hypothetical protein